MSAIRHGELETAAEMADALARGDVTSAELVERTLDRATAWQPVVNAFSQLWAEEALAEARLVDSRRATERAPFAGVPIAIKDLFDVAGHETTGCSLAFEGNVAERDAAAITAVREAGLVMVGKTNQQELAAGGTNLQSSIGRTCNPWDPSRITGGSSGGSAAAVAAGIVPWALGSDTGGSIRIPSSMCGAFGLKPTTGRLSTDGVMPLSPSMDCPGPIAGTAGDLGGLSLVLGLGAERATDGTVRIGVPDGFFAEHVDDEVLAAVDGAAGALRDAGTRVERIDGGGLRDVRHVWSVVCFCEFANAYRDLSEVRRARISPEVRSWLEAGESVDDEQRAEAAAEQKRIAEWFDERLRDREALLVPTTPYPAFEATARAVELGRGRSVDVEHVGPGWLTCAVNLAGLPALSVPVARSARGLPIGVSLVGRRNDDERLLGLAGRLSTACRLDRATAPL